MWSWLKTPTSSAHMEADDLSPVFDLIPHDALFAAWQQEVLNRSREACERSLFHYLRESWPHFDSSIFTSGWHLEAIAEHLEAVSNGQIRRLLINIPPRFGKACAHNTPVLTTIGWSTHGELSIGDQVFGPDGRPATVIALSPDVSEVVPVELTNGETIRCHKNHEWTVYDRASKPHQRHRTMETKRIARTRLWSGGRARFQLPAISALHFPVPVVLPIHPYALGAWLGDGSSAAARLAYAASDRVVLDAMVEAGCIVSAQRIHPTTGVHYADFVGGFWSSLRLMGLLNNKHIPEIYLRSNYEQRLQLLAGLVDTDGTVDENGRITINTCSPALRDGIIDLLTSLGQRPYVIVSVPKPRPERAIQGRQTVFLCGFQPTVRLPTRIPRKQNKIIAPQRAVGIKSIGPVEPGAARSIQVDRPDGLYLVGKKLNPTHNTNLVAVAWPTWTWAKEVNPNYPLHGAGVRFLCASYGANKAEGDGVTARRLIGSEWYQERWGDRVVVSKDRDNQGQYDTEAGGSRISTGIPESLGKGGAIRIIDDPHKTDEVESDKVREGVIRAYDEVWRTRSNDPVYGAEVVVMQRLAEGDISGHLLEERDVVHLCLPLEYDPQRHCHTVLGFDDPRKDAGELLWPARFDRNWVARQRRVVGPHAYAGQYQQTPVARGGGIVLREWWKAWPPEAQEDSWYRTAEEEGKTVRRLIFPSLDYVMLSVDTAYTEKEENDWSACTVWGVFEDTARNPKIILLEAWRERIELRALTMKILETARRRKADSVLIEAKASGLSVIQEMRRLMREGEFSIFGEVPKGDKVARLHAVVPAFAAGMIYAPDRKWADMVIDEVSQFPRSRFKDLTDTCSAAIKKLRDIGLAKHTNEVESERMEALMFHGNKPTTRQEYGV